MKKSTTPAAAATAVFQHENRKGVIYYLHAGRTKTGKPRYFFASAPATIRS